MACMWRVFLLFLVAIVNRAAYADEDVLVTEKVFLDIELEGNVTGRIIIGLFGSTSPKTVRNFVGLVNHEVR